MTDKITLAASTLIISLAACSQEANVNPPTDPAEPVTAAAVNADIAPAPGDDPTPVAFTGRWAAQPEWCANTSATTAMVPIEITTTEFRGHENVCAIGPVDEVEGGWEAQLRCQAEGTTSTERVRFTVVGEALNISWMDRDSGPVTLVRCGEGPA